MRNLEREDEEKCPGNRKNPSSYILSRGKQLEPLLLTAVGMSHQALMTALHYKRMSLGCGISSVNCSTADIHALPSKHKIAGVFSVPCEEKWNATIYICEFSPVNIPSCNLLAHHWLVLTLLELVDEIMLEQAHCRRATVCGGPIQDCRKNEKWRVGREKPLPTAWTACRLSGGTGNNLSLARWWSNEVDTRKEEGNESRVRWML